MVRVLEAKERSDFKSGLTGIAFADDFHIAEDSLAEEEETRVAGFGE